MSDKLRLDPNQLTMRDMKRARVVLDGRNPWELIEDPIESIILTIWCLRSRDDPEFAWSDAEDTPMGEFDMTEPGEPPDPPTLSPEPSGSPSEPPSATSTGSTSRPRGRSSGSSA